jgi:hypothetical protein
MGYAEGGYTRAKASDTIPIVVETGYVYPASLIRSLGPNLVAALNGKPQQMISVGDYVTINGQALTWMVLSFNGPDVSLRSGQTGRRRVEPLKNLRLFQKGNA